MAAPLLEKEAIGNKESLSNVFCLRFELKWSENSHSEKKIKPCDKQTNKTGTPCPSMRNSSKAGSSYWFACSNAAFHLFSLQRTLLSPSSLYVCHATPGRILRNTFRTQLATWLQTGFAPGRIPSAPKLCWRQHRLVGKLERHQCIAVGLCSE